MIELTSFTETDFDLLISWIDSKELLIQIAGHQMIYPVTNAQLEHYLQEENSFAFNVVDTASNKIIGHAQIQLVDEVTCKLDKVLIGDKSNRGKGLGQQLMDALLKLSFERFNASKVELNVFDWNIAARKAYEKTGFLFNHDKTMQFAVDGVTWTAVNMTIDKNTWLEKKSNI